MVTAGSTIEAGAQSWTDCDRSRLGGFLDDYISALAVRDPSRLAVATDVRFTENGRKLDVRAGQHLIAGDIAMQLQTGAFRSDRLSILAEALSEYLEALRTSADDPVGEVIALVRHMTVDRERVEKTLIFDAEQLRRHHRTTFVHSLNLLLIAAGASTRARDVPELVDALGWCSTVRDLEEDFEHGLINVPAEIVTAAREEGASLDNVRNFLSAVSVRQWLAEELQRAESLLDAHGQRRAASDDPTGRRILRIFERSIGGYVRRFGAGSRPVDLCRT